jgi:frataxin-like iron-binding protein CyaY
MLKLVEGQYVKLTGMEVKGENDIYIVDWDRSVKREYYNVTKDSYSLHKVKLDGTKKQSGYNLVNYDAREIKKNPNMKIEVVTDLKKAKKEINEYLKARESEEIVVTFEKADCQEVKHLSIIRMTEGLKIGFWGESYLSNNSLWKVKIREDKTIYITELGKKGQELSNSRMYGCNLALTNQILSKSEVVEKIETKKGDMIAETKKEVEPVEVIENREPVQEIITETPTVETIEEQNEVKTESNELASTQQIETNEIEFTVSEDTHTKTGKKIFVAKLTRTLSKAEFINISIRIKPLGGYYSSFKKGFLFDNNPIEALQKEFNTNAVNETIENIESIQEPQKAEQQPEIIINEELAKRAKENMSFNDYKEGSATEEYNRVVENMTQKINEATEQVKDDSEKISQLDYLLNKFKKDYANWTNKHNANGAIHVSWMISGRGNYNMNKHNKWESREGKLWAEYNDIMAIDDKIDKIIYSKKIIKSTDSDALEKLKEKLAEEQKAHDEMVSYNKQARKENKEVYPTYMLTNSNQRIKNIKDRISQLEKLEELKQTKGNTEIEINGIKIVDNLEANRVQMIFPDKPEENIRKILKSNGFRYSYTYGAWQRNRNSLSMMKAKSIAESLKDNNSIAV